MHYVWWAESKYKCRAIIMLRQELIQVIKFCVTGDQLPVDISDIDLHILRCLLHYMCTSIKTIYFLVSKKQLEFCRDTYHH